MSRITLFCCLVLIGGIQVQHVSATVSHLADLQVKTLNLETTVSWKPIRDVEHFSVKYTQDESRWTYPANCQNINATSCFLGILDNEPTFNPNGNDILMIDWTVCVNTAINENPEEKCQDFNQKRTNSVSCPTDNDVTITASNDHISMYVQAPESPYYDENGNVIRMSDGLLGYGVSSKFKINGENIEPVVYGEFEKLPKPQSFSGLTANSMFNISIISKYGGVGTESDVCTFEVWTLSKAPDKPANIISTKRNGCMSHDVRVDWQEPPQDQNGEITRYEIKYALTDTQPLDFVNQTVNASLNYVILKNLTCSEYIVLLETWNSVGSISDTGSIEPCEDCTTLTNINDQQIKSTYIALLVIFIFFFFMALVFILGRYCRSKHFKNKFVLTDNWINKSKLFGKETQPCRNNTKEPEKFDQLKKANPYHTSYNELSPTKAGNCVDYKPRLDGVDDVDCQPTPDDDDVDYQSRPDDNDQSRSGAVVYCQPRPSSSNLRSSSLVESDTCPYSKIDFPLSSDNQKETDLFEERPLLIDWEAMNSGKISSHSSLNSLEHYSKAELFGTVPEQNNDSGYIDNTRFIRDYNPHEIYTQT
ncbi:uncharacterized protein [Antedon mediterranea]|uniref:uncharacterized protein n=1 Tax=Antedon mediterranea TaxID=105859 RepID=UPI003AF8F16C